MFEKVPIIHPFFSLKTVGVDSRVTLVHLLGVRCAGGWLGCLQCGRAETLMMLLECSCSCLQSWRYRGYLRYPVWSRDFVGFLVDEEEIVVAVVERVGQFNEHVVWGRARLMFVMVLRHPVVPNGRFGTVCVGDCAHAGFVWMERVRRTGVVPGWVWVGVGAVGRPEGCYCSWLVFTGWPLKSKHMYLKQQQ